MNTLLLYSEICIHDLREVQIQAYGKSSLASCPYAKERLKLRRGGSLKVS